MTKIEVYVRKGEVDGTRTISIKIPLSIPSIHFLGKGYGIDGNTAVKTIDKPLYKALLAEERMLKEWLESYNFEVVFV